MNVNYEAKPGQYSAACAACAACAELTDNGLAHDNPLIIHFLDRGYRNVWAAMHTHATGHQVTLIEPETA